MATRRIKFIKPYQMFGVGQEAELDAPIADLLIGRGVAREVQTPAPQKATKIMTRKQMRKHTRNANR